MTPIIAMAIAIAAAIAILATLILKVRKTMINCKTCRNTKNCVYAGEETEREECRDHIPTTNSDLLRAKTDEELARWLESAVCPHDKCPEINAGDKTEHCIKCWLNWLKAEVN